MGPDCSAMVQGVSVGVGISRKGRMKGMDEGISPP
jgi:hypothetical protein